MAENLAAFLADKSLAPLTLWNRTEAKLPEEGTKYKHAKSPKQMAKDLDIIFTSLGSDEAARSVYDELFEGARERVAEAKKDGKHPTNLVFVETSTLYPRFAGELEREASKIGGVYYLQCPVFGPPPVAQDAELVFVLSGEYRAKKRVEQFIVPALARKAIDVGSNVERAASFKLCGNFVTLGLIELLAEGMTLADKTGVTSELLLEFVKECLPAGPAISYGTKIRENDFQGDTGFTVEGGLKDANHLRHLAAENDCIIPTVDRAHSNLITARAVGGGSLDWSSLVAGPRLAAGLSPFTGLKAGGARDDGFGSKTDEGEGILLPVRSGPIVQVNSWEVKREKSG